MTSRINSKGKSSVYMQQTMQILAENRVPTAHRRYTNEHVHSCRKPKIFTFSTFSLLLQLSNYRDTPLKSPAEIDFHLSEIGQAKIEAWVEVEVARILTSHCPALKSCEKFIK